MWSHEPFLQSLNLKLTQAAVRRLNHPSERLPLQHAPSRHRYRPRPRQKARQCHIRLLTLKIYLPRQVSWGRARWHVPDSSQALHRHRRFPCHGRQVHKKGVARRGTRFGVLFVLLESKSKPFRSQGLADLPHRVPERIRLGLRLG